MLFAESGSPGGASEVALSLNPSAGFGNFFEALKSKFQPGPAPESRPSISADQAPKEAAGAAAKDVNKSSDISDAADTASETVKSVVGAAPSGDNPKSSSLFTS